MLVAATMARAKEEENLQSIASLEERHEKQLRLQARQRHDMEKRRMLNQDEDDKFIRLLDHGTVAAPGGLGGELAGRYPVAGADFDGVLDRGVIQTVHSAFVGTHQNSV